MQGPDIQLFVTCLVDTMAPEVGRASVSALEATGRTVGFPEGQSCCGQPAFNVGLWDMAREMAAHALDVLDGTEGPIVVPSGSCAEMLIHHYPALFAETDRKEQASRVSERTVELTRYLTSQPDAPSASCDGCEVAYHYSCHGLRGLGLAETADQLLEGVDRVELEGDTECCGFGGLFSVEMPSVSTAIMDDKLDKVEASGATMLVGSDVSCLMHMEGGLRRRGSDIEVKHIAELLGSGDG